MQSPPILSRALHLGLLLLPLAATGTALPPQDVPPGPPDGQDPRPDGPPPGAVDTRERGVLVHESTATGGYTVVAPLRSKTVYLVDADGEEVHRWETNLPPGQTAELLPNGHLLRAARSEDNERFGGGGEGGRLQEYDWEGNLVWDLALSSDAQLSHHDFELLPNGNVLVLVWEHVDAATAEARGRFPGSVAEAGLWPDAILELEPRRPDGAEVVWEWHAFDHLVQDVDPALPGYGSVAAHPERLNVNRGASESLRPETEAERKERLELERRLAALGYSGDDGDQDGDDGDADDGDRDRGAGRRGSDWMHTNSVDLDPELDLIVISLREWSELLVIDHSTTTEEAAGSTGGRHGRGGDVLWRWGNPANFDQGGEADRRLYGQHDVRWTRDGDAVALSIYNNGDQREPSYSSVELVHVPLVDGRFVTPADGRLPKVEAAWTYTAPERESFYSSHISGVQPLGNDRFLVCEGQTGRAFEVDRAGHVHWEFISPFDGEIQRGGPGRDRGRGGDRGDRRPGGPDGRPAGGPPGGGPPGGGPPGGGPPGRGRGGPGGGPGGQHFANSLFRVYRVPADFPGVARLSEASGD